MKENIINKIMKTLLLLPKSATKAGDLNNKDEMNIMVDYIE
jgi:hypothetical protein